MGSCYLEGLSAGPHTPPLQLNESQSLSLMQGQPIPLGLAMQGSDAAPAAAGAVMDMITGRAIAVVSPKF
jgi:hypothetical protein